MKMNTVKALSFVMLSLIVMQATSAPIKQTPAAHETIAQREQKAFELFMHLLVCPIDQVPTWKEFVDKMAHLMEGNPKYAALRTSLLSVREATGFLGKMKIANVLIEHETVIPEEIVKKTQSLGLMERKNRIKLS